jgi:hypothetical protein
MRCISCNVALTDYESTRKSLVTNDYFDMCNSCFKTIKNDLAYRDRLDLISSNDFNEVDDLNINIDNINLDDY